MFQWRRTFRRDGTPRDIIPGAVVPGRTVEAHRPKARSGPFLRFKRKSQAGVVASTAYVPSVRKRFFFQQTQSLGGVVQDIRRSRSPSGWFKSITRVERHVRTQKTKCTKPTNTYGQTATGEQHKERLL